MTQQQGEIYAITNKINGKRYICKEHFMINNNCNGNRSERCHGLDDGLMYSLLPCENMGIIAT